MGAFINQGVKIGLVDKAGAWYSYGCEKIGQGKANFAKFLEENPEISSEIELNVRGLLLPKAKDEKSEQLEAEI